MLQKDKPNQTDVFVIPQARYPTGILRKEIQGLELIPNGHREIVLQGIQYKTGSSDLPTQASFPKSIIFQQKFLYAAILALCTIALFLRFHRLGELNYWADEDITALAVQGVLEHGAPLLPSGKTYFRSPITIYISALSASLLGFTEFALRLPSLLFSLGTGLLLFAFGKRTFSVWVGLAALLIHTFSAWDIEFSRQARMYEAFAFFYTLALYAIYRGWIEKNGRWKKATIFLSAATVFVHLFGGTLALLYFYLGWRWKDFRLNPILCLGAGIFIGGLALAQFILVQCGFGASPGEVLTSIFTTVSAFVHIPTAGAALTFALVFFSASKLTVSEKTFQHIQQSVLPLIIIIAVASGQTLTGALVIAGYALLSGHGLTIFSHKHVRLALAILVIGGLYHLFWAGGEIASFEKLFESFKALVGFPKIYFLGFLYAFPVMALTVIAGLPRLFYKNQKAAPRGTDILLAGFILPLFVNGYLVNKLVEYRINFFLNPLFILIFAFAAAEMVQGVRKFLFRKKVSASMRVLGQAAVCSFFLFACEQISPANWLDVLQREYGSPVNRKTAPGSHFEFMPDHAGPAKFVSEHARAEDIVIALDLLVQTIYAKKIDYWLRTETYAHQSSETNAGPLDVYTGTPILTSLAQLRHVFAERGRRRIFVITAPAYMQASEHVSNNVLRFLNSLENQCGFLGGDGQTRAYVIPPQDDFNTGESQ